MKDTLLSRPFVLQREINVLMDELLKVVGASQLQEDGSDCKQTPHWSI